MERFRDLPLRATYTKGRHDIAAQFYLPVLAVAKTYDRAVAFFSSAVFMISWPSLRRFVAQGGRIRLVCSPVLTADDISTMEDAYADRNSETTRQHILTDIETLIANPVLSKPARVLGALVASGVLDVRVATVHGDVGAGIRRIFHDKLGILEDHSKDAVVFRGSMNETFVGLSSDGNLEAIDVSVSWGGPRDETRVVDAVEYFDLLWRNLAPGVVVEELPDAAKKLLLQNAATLTGWESLVDEIAQEQQTLNALHTNNATSGPLLRPHQSGVLWDWLRKGRRGIIDHITGAGKTTTALWAISDSLSRGETPVILVPSTVLLQQWYVEIQKALPGRANDILVCGDNNTDWKEQDLVRRWAQRGIILTTMQTAASSEFLRQIQQVKSVFLIVDEVHRIGSPHFQRALQITADPRLGLSATPQRYGDPAGTAAIFSYFGTTLEPTLQLTDAIKSKILCPYLYYPHIIRLSGQEQDQWNEHTLRIKRLYAIQQATPSSELEERIRLLLIERSRIAKTASAKVLLAHQVLAERYEHGQRWIVYCDDSRQLDAVLEVLQRAKLPAIRYMSDLNRELRRESLRMFNSTGGVLVAIRCLDEGVDIPAVTHALILASSQNPREHIQRRGRVLRMAPGKRRASIHDALVLPEGIDLDRQMDSLVLSELSRAILFGKDAENVESVAMLERIAVKLGIKIEDLAQRGSESLED